MADLVIRPSIKGIILWYVLSALLLVGIVVFLQSRDFQPTELWALIAIPLAIDLFASLKHVRLNARRLTLAQGVLRYEDGLVGKTQRNIVLDKIRDVRLDQTLGQRLVGVGNLTVEAIGESGTISLENVDRPREAADAILEAMRQARHNRF
jgi:uncharacterized membrane protein YdbT with pleckstrin-like domain